MINDDLLHKERIKCNIGCYAIYVLTVSSWVIKHEIALMKNMSGKVKSVSEYTQFPHTFLHK